MSDTKPKAEPAGNAAKDPDDWVTGDQSMTGAQASYLKTLSEEAGEEFDDGAHQGRHHAVPAADQDDHRAAGLRDPGRGRRAHGRHAALGRVGARTMAWFITASLVSLTLGLILVNTLQPGVGLNLPLPPVNAASGVDTSGFDLAKFVTHLVPASGIAAMATTRSCRSSSSRCSSASRSPRSAKRPSRWCAASKRWSRSCCSHRLCHGASPLRGVRRGGRRDRRERPGHHPDLWPLHRQLLPRPRHPVAVAVRRGLPAVVGKRGHLFRYIRDPLVLAFSTASSEAAYPRTLEALDKFGVPPRIASFVLPLGYSFNLDGSMMYMTFATIFIAQAYGIDLTIGQEILLLLTLMITSKGIAGRAARQPGGDRRQPGDVQHPEAGLLLILAVDHFLDMGRSATNVVGNAVASVLVAKWEGSSTWSRPRSSLRTRNRRAT
jgi:hypothetical protein